VVQVLESNYSCLGLCSAGIYIDTKVSDNNPAFSFKIGGNNVSVDCLLICGRLYVGRLCGRAVRNISSQNRG
jgi:hypothetical protein